MTVEQLHTLQNLSPLLKITLERVIRTISKTKKYSDADEIPWTHWWFERNMVKGCMEHSDDQGFGGTIYYTYECEFPSSFLVLTEEELDDVIQKVLEEEAEYERRREELEAEEERERNKASLEYHQQCVAALKEKLGL